MRCNSPKRLHIKHTETGEPFTLFVPCGKCYACQCRNRGELALRVQFEVNSSRTISSHFVTWTYDNEHLPADYLDYDSRMQTIYLEMLKKNRKTRDWGFSLLRPDDLSKSIRNLQSEVKRIGLRLVPDSIASDEIKNNRLLRYVISGEYGDITHRTSPLSRTSIFSFSY